MKYFSHAEFSFLLFCSGFLQSNYGGGLVRQLWRLFGKQGLALVYTHINGFRMLFFLGR